MVEVREVIENSLIFNDDIWAAIYKDIKKYFSKMNIVGWFVSVPYRVRDDLIKFVFLQTELKMMKISICASKGT